MKKSKILLYSFLHAIGVSLYIFIIAFILMYGGQVFPNMDKTILGPIAFLSLFVISAAITGSLVLARPVMLYLEKQKKDAILFFICTIIWIAFFTIIALLGNIIVNL